MGRTPGLILPLLTALGLCTVGCGPDITLLCTDTEDCRGGNDADIEACAAVYDYASEVADIEGCTEEYEVYIACFIDTASCVSSDTGVACGDSGDCKKAGYTSCSNGMCKNKSYTIKDPDDCEAETNAYNRCL